MSEWRQTLGRAGVCGTQGYYVEATAWTGLSQALSPVEMSQYMCFPKGRKASAFAGKLASELWFGRLLVVVGLVTELYLTFVTPWTVAHQAPLSMGFSRQECWSGLPCPSPGVYSRPRDATHISCIAGVFFTTEPPGKSLQDY